MPQLTSNVLTLADWAKRLDPAGKIDYIVEILSQTNEVLSDMLWGEGNLPTGDRITIRTGLPTAYWRAINQGTPNSKSQTAQVTEQCGILSVRSSVDQDEAELNGEVARFRLSESKPFMEAMSQEMASTVFYGAATDPEEFVGLAPRYGDLSSNSAENIINAGGSGSDNCSIWLIGWGEHTVKGIFPKGSKVGISHEDLGLQDEFDADGARYRAYMDLWKWKAGLCVKDWRYAARTANIDVSDMLADDAGSTVKLLEYMVKMINRLPTTMGVRPAFYVNRTVKQMIDIQAMNKSNVYLTIDNVAGKPITSIQGIPIRRVDALTNSEAKVV